MKLAEREVICRNGGGEKKRDGARKSNISPENIFHTCTFSEMNLCTFFRNR